MFRAKAQAVSEAEGIRQNMGSLKQSFFCYAFVINLEFQQLYFQNRTK